MSGDHFAQFRRDAGYAFPGDSTASPAATFLALEGEVLDGRDVAGAVRDSVQAQARTLSPQLALDHYADFGVPVLAALSTISDRVDFLNARPDATTLVAKWRAKLLALGPSPSVLSLLAELAQVAHQQRLTWTPIDQRWIKPTVNSATGYVQLSGSEGDPQLTYDALEIGFSLPQSRLGKALRTGYLHGRWLGEVSSSDLLSTVSAVIVFNSCNDRDPLKSFSVARMLKASAMRPQTAIDVYRVGLIAHLLNQRIARSTEEELLSVYLHDSARAADPCGDRVRAHLLALWISPSFEPESRSLSCSGQDTSRTLLAQFELSQASKSSYKPSQMSKLASALRTADGLYRYRTSDLSPDLYSSVVGAAVTSESNSLSPIKREFMTSTYWTLNPSETGSPATLLAAAIGSSLEVPSRVGINLLALF